MHLIAMAWVYVVLLMAAAEVASPDGTWLGAAFTVLLYGVLPLGIVLYIGGGPMRRRARQRRDAEGRAAAASAIDPDGRGVPAGNPVAPEREEV